MASLPIEPDAAGRPRIPVRINGRPRQFVVDTGGIATMVTHDAAKELRLPNAPAHAARLVFVNGDSATSVAHARSFHVGRMAVGRFTFLVTPPSIHVPGAAGALAPDVMRNFDVEIDFARNRMNLFRPDSCPGNPVYWTSRPHAAMSFTLDDGHMSATAMLDGKLVDLIIDTGAAATVMNLEDAKSEFGIAPGSHGVTPIGYGPSDADRRYAYHFGVLNLEGLAIERPRIVLRPDQSGLRQAGLRPELILGMGELSKLHLYIAYGERKLYITAAGDR
jgi:predicted aspartyl protease